MRKTILQIFTAILALGLFCGAAAAAPVASFSSNTSSGSAPLSVQFADTSTGNVTIWNWSFDDGTQNETIKNPVHTFSTVGNHSVRLTVTDNDGVSSGPFEQTINVLAPVLKADFEPNVTEGAIPLTVKFTDKSTNAVTYNWNFGDNSTDSTSAESSPTHTYTTAGKYNVSLIVYNGSQISEPKYIDIVAKAKDNSTGYRIWEDGMPKTYTWNAQSFSGFYYDLDSGVSSEEMTITDIGKTIDKGNIEYVTKPTETKFDHSSWGTYQIVGFMAEKYFAGYTENSSAVKEYISPISNGILSKILIDSDDKKSVTSGESLAFEEGYSLSIKEVDVNGNSVWVQLEKDGKVVDDEFVSSGQDFVYKGDLGKTSDVPIILAHFGTVFHGAENDAVFVQGIFQISDNYQEVSDGDDFGEMEVTSVSSDEIKMENSNDIGLSRGDTVDLMGKIKIQVADASILRFAPVVDTSAAGTYELRGTVYDKEKNGDLPFNWNPLNFEGFYYNIDEGIGTENLTVNELSGSTIPSDQLVYKSTPQTVNFEHSNWGNFTVVGFMASKYFAGYPEGVANGEIDRVSLLSSDILTQVLTDSDDKKSFTQGSAFALEQGYSLNIKEVDVNGKSVWVQLEKDGKVVDDEFVGSDDDFIYKTDVGKATDVPLIIVHFGTVFSGAENSAVFVQGIFQISDEYTEIKSGDTFDKMEVTSVSDDGITMKNTDSIGLNKGEDTTIMSNVSFKTADSGTLRFYPFVKVESGGSTTGLNIGVPDEITVGNTFDITVTANGTAVDGVNVKVDGNSTGTTSADGIVQYTAANTGTLKITAEKSGYSTVSKSVNVTPPKDEMSLSVYPDKVYIGDNITISALKKIGGDPIVGANISIDGQPLGVTGSDGNLTYKTDKNGTIKVTAVKEGFNNNSIDVKVRDFEAIFTVSSLTVNPMEVGAGKNATVSATIVNTGNAAGKYNASLLINGNVTESKEVSIDVGGNKTITFSHKEEKPGNYTAVLGEKTVTYKVKENSPVLLYALGAVVLLLIGGAAYYFTKGGGDIGAMQEKVQELISSIKLKR